MVDYEKIKARIRLLYDERKFDQCIRECNYLLELLGEDDIKIKKFCYLEMAFCYRKQDEYDKAMEYTDKAIEYAKIKEEYYSCLWNKGHILYNIGEVEKAVDLFDQCLPFYKKHKMYKEVAGLLINKAYALRDKNIYLEAIKYYDKAEDIPRASYDYVYSLLAELCINIKDAINLETERYIRLISSPDKQKELRAKLYHSNDEKR